MKPIKTLVTVALFWFFMAAPIHTKESQAISILGFNFTEDGWSAAMVSILSSIEALNEVANSKVFDLFGEFKELKKISEDVMKTVNQVREYYAKGERMYYLTQAGYYLYSMYIETAGMMAKNSDILSPSEIRYMLSVTEYVVFDISKAFNIGRKTTLDEVGGGILTELKQMFDFLGSAKNEQAAMNAKTMMDKMEEAFKPRITNMQLVQKWVYGVIEKRKLEKGIFDLVAARQSLYEEKYKTQERITDKLLKTN